MMLTSDASEICLGMDKLRNIILQGRNSGGFVDAVTFAGSRLQPCAVENFQAAPAVTDQPPPLQADRDRGHARALYAEYHRDVFLSQRQGVLFAVIEADQQPAAETLLRGVEVIADGRLSHLRQHRVRVQEHQVMRRAAMPELFTQGFGADAPGLSRDLHYRAEWNLSTFQGERAADHPLETDHPDSNRIAPARGRKHRNHSPFWKVNVRDRVARVVNDFPFS